MIIGVFSDTHDNISNLEKAKQIFIKSKVAEAFFCGDLCSPFTLKFLADWPFKIHAVLGNNEGDLIGIKRRLEKYQMKNFLYPEKPLFYEGQIESKKIAVFHGHINKFTDSLISSQEYNFVFTGHTHQAQIKEQGKTIWINPGSVTGVSEDPSIKRASVAIVNSKESHREIIYLS